MVRPDGLAAVPTNWGDTQNEVVSFVGDYQVVNTTTLRPCLRRRRIAARWLP
ncbi:MAG TPA: hypothetical protein VFN62_12365 [Acidobacteriaceae bacterium]|nr:hypothetical protein [Acidobacteriaceae bacterium]